jgi:hypothetical protein
MDDDLKRLEDLVARAVARLATLERERDGLREEVALLRGELAASAADVEARASERSSWTERRDHVAAAVRETLAALGAD